MIKVNLSEFIHAKPGSRETITFDLDNITINDLDLGYVKGKLHFTRVAYGILVEGKLNTTVKTECNRCLTLFYVPVLVELDDVISLPGADLTPERPVRVAEDGWADLAPLIREYAWLGLPVKPLCSPNCKGICPNCGGNINLGECVCDSNAPIDPRWEVLRALVDRTEKS